MVKRQVKRIKLEPASPRLTRSRSLATTYDQSYDRSSTNSGSGTGSCRQESRGRDIIRSSSKRLENQKQVEVKIETSKIKVETSNNDVEEYLPSDDKPSHIKVPPNWLEMYNLIKNMRARIVAPVDTMGCERLPEPVSKSVSVKVHRFQLLIALMLSAQTKDEINAIAMENLRQGLKDKGGLTLQAIRDTSVNEIDRMIYKVGFHTRKANYIKQTAEILHEKFNDDIPQNLADMLALPGVGPKMSHLLLHRAWGKVEGIGVDVHVHRLANMFNWVPKSCENSPEKTRIALESWLPRDYWVDINPMLVGFGQTICTPRVSKCELCDLASTGFCKKVDRKRLRKYAVKPEPSEILQDIEDLG